MKKIKKQNRLKSQYNRDSEKPKWKIFTSAFIVFLLFLGVGYKALTLQVTNRDKSFKIAIKQHSGSLNLLPKRGNILDRHNRYLATSVNNDSIFINPRQIKEPKKFSKQVSENTNFKYKQLLAHAVSNKSFLWLKRLADKGLVDKLKEMDIEGIGFIQEPKRVYPNGHLLGQVLGFTNIDSKGIDGIEYYLNGVLVGKPREIKIKKDARGKQMLYTPVDIEESTRGFDIELTIDSKIQHIVEKELSIGIKKMGAESGMALVMQPDSGEILAMASYPFFNPNRINEFPENSRRNLPLWYLFEPGSTLKIFLVAAALEENIVNPNSKYDCENGKRKVGPKVIKDVHPYGVLTVSEVIEVSSNICASKIGENIGKKSFHNYLKDFGFGEKLGVDMPGEPAGILLNNNKWGPVELATISFGQGISVSSLQ
ncbi:MAG: peptidoglycan D,D-transpeptidase FtsI family protein, partial [Thermodesulfobacteriota bacterium]